MVFQVGDEVLLVEHYSRNRPRRPVKIAKVGRKYVYYQGSSTPFDKETGAMVGDYSGHASLRTHEEQARIDAREEALRALRGLGVDLTGYKARELATAILEAVHPLIATRSESEG